MKEILASLRGGWCGNKLHGRDAADPDILVKPSMCGLLAKQAIKMANTCFIAICPGLSRLVGNLECDYSLVQDVDTREFPIGLGVVLDFAHEVIVVDNKDNSSNTNDSDDKELAN